MRSVASIPVDRFLDEVFSALERGDASTLRQLEDAATAVTAPVNPAEYLRKRETLARLLEMTARNLRTIRRAADQHLPGPYAMFPRY